MVVVVNLRYGLRGIVAEPQEAIWKMIQWKLQRETVEKESLPYSKGKGLGYLAESLIQSHFQEKAHILIFLFLCSKTHSQIFRLPQRFCGPLINMILEGTAKLPSTVGRERESTE